MSARSPRAVVLLVLPLALPLALGVVAAVVVVVARVNGTLDVRVPVATILVVVGALASLALGGWMLVRRRIRAAFADGRSAGYEAERAAHRRFMARLDHELKNPITAIRSALQTEQGAPNSPGLMVALGQSNRLAGLVGELRSLAALEAAPIERASVRFDELARAESDAVVDDLAARGIHRSFTLHFPEAPWPLPPVAGDPDLLAIVVRNLLLNAVKYSDPDVRVEITGRDDAGWVALEVADTGWGIPADEVPHVWDELWRGGRARGTDGSGLGLSLVRVVVERHGGTVHVRSRVGAGTSVILRMPVAR